MRAAVMGAPKFPDAYCLRVSHPILSRHDKICSFPQPSTARNPSRCASRPATVSSAGSPRSFSSPSMCCSTTPISSFTYQRPSMVLTPRPETESRRWRGRSRWRPKLSRKIRQRELKMVLYRCGRFVCGLGLGVRFPLQQPAFARVTSRVKSSERRDPPYDTRSTPWEDALGRASGNPTRYSLHLNISDSPTSTVSRRQELVFFPDLDYNIHTGGHGRL